MHADPTTTRKDTRAVSARHCSCVPDYVCGRGDVKAGGLTSRNQAVLGFCGAPGLVTGALSQRPPHNHPASHLHLSLRTSQPRCDCPLLALLGEFLRETLPVLARLHSNVSKYIHWWKASRSSQTLKFSLSRSNNTPAHGTVLLHARPLLLVLSSESQPSEHCPD
jgi:hypothetical protein